MIMRYQRMGPEGGQSSSGSGNGRRIGSSGWRTCREDEDNGAAADSNGTAATGLIPRNPSFEGKTLSRFRSPSKTHQDHIPTPHFDTNGFAAGGGGGRSDSSSPPQAAAEKSHRQEESNGTGSLSSSPSRKGVGGGEGLLQWGHRKRSRCSRSESGRIGVVVVGMANDHESSSSSSIQLLQGRQAAMRVHRRSMADKLSAITNAMPPPPPSSSNAISRAHILKSFSKDHNSSSSSPNRRSQEDRSGGANASTTRTSNGAGNGRAASSRSKVGKRSPSLAEKFAKRNNSSGGITTGQIKEEKMNGCSSVQHRQDAAGASDPSGRQLEQAAAAAANVNDEEEDNNNNNNGNAKTTAAAGGGGGERANGGGGEANEWPRIYIALSRKEKEEDFLVMKGTKLPHRPKKRPKTIDRVLQYCFPGMWLSDLTKGRYEVREKKCTKKRKRRGLKGMESMESDSE